MTHRLRTIARFGPLCVLLLVCVGCATTPDRPSVEILPDESEAAGGFDAWLEGTSDPSELEVPAPEKAPGASEAAKRRFVAAEIDYWAGDAERAFDRYRALLEEQTSSSLVRFAAARVYDLRDAVVDWRSKTEELLEGLAYREFGPVTRLYLSLAGQTVAYRRWASSDEAAPFRADELGFPARWHRSPRFSPWRVADFDRTFPPERTETLADEYVTPWFAEDRPVNRARSRPYFSGGLALSPSFGRDGVYYLETFATVAPTEAAGDGAEASSGRAYWLYGDFSGGAKVWVDGELALERATGEYGTGKRFRRVTLEPGRHRILVKLAYESGYRDWFDLALLGDAAGPTGGSGLTFAPTREEIGSGGSTASSGELEFGGDQKKPGELEPIYATGDAVDRAGDAALYATALAAYYGRQPTDFERAWGELMERHENFAAGWGLKAEQVQTLWSLPGDKRRARTISYLRKARDRDTSSVKLILELVERLQEKSNPDKVGQLLGLARRGARTGEEGGRRLRNVRVLEAWATHLANRGWDAKAEEAWSETLEADPSNCRAARALHRLHANRSFYPPLEELTPRWKSCRQLQINRLMARKGRRDEKVAYRAREAARHPYSAGRRIAWVDALVRNGREERAEAVLEEGRDRMPWSTAIWERLAEWRLADEGREEALTALRRGMEAVPGSVRLFRRMDELRDSVPLEDLMRDGREIAMEHLESGDEAGERGGDQAYYVLDYAARVYRPDGRARTLTHTVVRTMTKEAIDRFGETSIPGNAELLLARTINRDGSVRMPDRASGKSTLSMPALDPGDFVEIAYLQHQDTSSKAESHLEGLRFFFRMSDISSLHSEYEIFGTRDGKFVRQNDSPEPIETTRDGQEGVRFLREESPSPRTEPHSVQGTEFLPWIQYYREGLELPTFEANRRYALDRALGSLEVNRELRRAVENWREGVESESVAEMKRLFYRTTQRITDASPGQFGRDVSHAFVSGSGSPPLLLHAVYQLAGVPSEIYLVKSRYQHPDEFPVREFAKYRRVLVRAEKPDGEPIWLQASHADAMFGAVGRALTGQPAVCVTCRDRVERTVPDEAARPGEREVEIEGTVDGGGELAGSARMAFHGIRAVAARRTLRRIPQPEKRQSYFGRVLGQLVPGSTLEEWRVDGEIAHDESLVVSLEFVHSQFGRTSAAGGAKVDRPVLRTPLASAYAKLAERERPLMVGRSRRLDYRMRLDAAEDRDIELVSRAGTFERHTDYGRYVRKVEREGGELVISSVLDLPIQRVAPEDYPGFRRWALDVEQSARLEFRVR